MTGYQQLVIKFLAAILFMLGEALYIIIDLLSETNANYDDKFLVHILKRRKEGEDRVGRILSTLTKRYDMYNE